MIKLKENLGSILFDNFSVLYEDDDILVRSAKK